MALLSLPLSHIHMSTYANWLYFDTNILSICIQQSIYEKLSGVIESNAIWTITDVFLFNFLVLQKKLRDAFASKIRLLKNQNHKQHATFYEDLDTGSDRQRGKSSKSSTHAKRPDSLDPEFSESEWEIV